MKIIFTLTIIAILSVIACIVMQMGWIVNTSVSIVAFLLLVMYSEAEMSTRHSLNLFNHQTGVKLSPFQMNVIRIVERRIPYLVMCLVMGIIGAFVWTFRIGVVVLVIALIYFLIKH